jgi:hypothetical protein
MVVGGSSVGWGMDDARSSNHGRSLRGLGPKRSGSTLAVAAAILLASMYSAAVAQQPQDPLPNRIWGGCVLNDMSGVEAAVEASNRIQGDAQIAFVVVYSLQENDGQAVQAPGGASGFTGPIICKNPALTVTETDQTANLNNITILDAEEAFVLRYQSGSTVRKRICHSVDANTDCFNVGP